MARRLVLFALAVSLLVSGGVGAACGSDTGGESPDTVLPGTTTDSMTGDETVDTATESTEWDLPDSLRLDESDDGADLSISAGGIITLDLEANPSTGYWWEMSLDDPEASLLEQVDEPAFVSDDPDAMGAGGTITFTFRAVDAGEMTVRFVYVGPDMEQDPERTFEFHLVVD